MSDTATLTDAELVGVLRQLSVEYQHIKSIRDDLYQRVEVVNRELVDAWEAMMVARNAIDVAALVSD